MKLSKAENREKKYRKNRYGMGMDGRSIFVIQEVQWKKGQKARKEMEDKKNS